MKKKQTTAGICTTLLFIVTALLFITTALLGCSSDTKMEEAFEAGSAIGFKETAADKAPAPSTADFRGGDGGSGDNAPVSDVSEYERKRIKRGSMYVVVESLTEAEEKISRKVDQYGGYIESSSLYEETAYFTVKIPAESFDTFMASSEDLGEVKSKSISVEDVTDRFYDLENRIKNKRILMERYQEYLEEAESVEDLLSIERALNDVITEIERLEGSYKQLSSLIAYSTLNIELSLPSYEKETGTLPSIREGLRKIGSAVLTFLYYLIFVIVGIVIFGVPAIAVAALLYYLSFGKIGLVKKLFRSLSAKKTG